MGILPDMRDRLAALDLPQPFSVCELGSQGLSLPGQRNTDPRAWYAALGCGRYVSIDGNGLGTVTADLNKPLALCFIDFPNGEFTHREPIAFDLVTDFGTGEHIFDQAQVWRTIHDLAKPGGYVVFDRPTTDYHKHCFYLINEGLIRDLAAANGYELLWLTKTPMTRGALLRGGFRMPKAKRDFCIPQEGRYRKDLVVA